MNRSELASVIAETLGPMTGCCVWDIGSGEQVPSAASAVLEEAGVSLSYGFGIDPNLPEGAQGYRGTLDEFLLSDFCLWPRPDLVVCADAMHCIPGIETSFARLLQELGSGVPVIVWDCVCDETGSSVRVPAYELHACKAMIDRALGIPHAELFSRETLGRISRDLPVQWSAFRTVAGGTVSASAIEDSCQATLDYAELVADHTDVYAAVARKLRRVRVSSSKRYESEMRSVCIGTTAASSQTQQEQRQRDQRYCH